MTVSEKRALGLDDKGKVAQFVECKPTPATVIAARRHRLVDRLLGDGRQSHLPRDHRDAARLDRNDPRAGREGWVGS